MAPGGLAMVVEVAAVAGVGREGEVGAHGGVAIDRKRLIAGVQAAGEVCAVEHVGGQGVHNGSHNSGQDAHHTHYH